MNLFVLIVGIICSIVFIIFDIISSKYIKENWLTLFFGRALIFFIPMYFIFDEFKAESFVFIQYVAPFIIIKYIAGVVIRYRSDNTEQ